MVTKAEKTGETAVRPSGNALAAKQGRKAASAVIWAFAGFIIADMRIGGGTSPFGASLAAAGSPLCAAAAVFGMFGAWAAAGSLWSHIAELAAAAVTAVFVKLFGRKCSARTRALAAGAAYFISSAAVSAGNNGDWIMFLAVFFRAVMCFGGAYCLCETVRTVKNGFYSDGSRGSRGSQGSQDFRAAAMGITYMLLICALCTPHTDFINPGRIAAGFCTAAAARKFGRAGGGAVGILSAGAFLLAEQSLGRSGAMLAFAGLVTGMYASKGKYAVNAAFILSAFGITAAAGMPSGTPGFIADTGLAAALYCIIPEGLYLPKLNGIFASEEKADIRSDKLMFAAKVLEEVGEDVQTAAELFMRRSDKMGKEPYEEVKSSVCGSICTQRRCSAACGSISPDGIEGCFKAAQSIASVSGRITAKELPAGFEGCPKKDQIADGFCRAAGAERISRRRSAYLRRFLEGASEQLSASCGMICELSGNGEEELRPDEELSKVLKRLLEEEGFAVRSAQIAFDGRRRPFSEAFITAAEGFRDIHLSGVSDRLAALLGVRLARPVTMLCGGENDRLCRIRWRTEGRYVPDCEIEAEAAEGSSCGDSHTCFEDGLGRYYIILSDGMGRGGKAASRSALAVNLLRRMITGGIGRKNAVKMLNVIMTAASSEEIFTTVDIFSADLYTGEGRLIKMGAAPTAVFTREEGESPVMSVYSDSSAPVGIINGLSVTEERISLNESSRVLMTTDGIDITSAAVAAVLENEGLTCGQMCGRIMAAAEETEGERPDDRTAAVFRLYPA
ncbi:MAG: SpoIIE family protein phosphatase [Huintestinicola sp.]|uniref:SpoIIE family protein phosphatase n=1 Tax=Huintestinicola sp. TaxID=2981661 RepID=UPI003F01A2FC